MFGSAWNPGILGRSVCFDFVGFPSNFDPRGISVFWDDQMFESLVFPSNFGSAWNLCIFGKSVF